MSKRKSKLHMSTTPQKGDNLPSLQKLIVLHLATDEPQTINETVQAISKSYKPSWIAFNRLKEKKLIAKIDVKSYRGRKYPRFWLTDMGIITAIMEGVDSSKLLSQTKAIYPDAEYAHCFLQIMPFFDPVFVKMAYANAKGKGSLSFREIANLILAGAMMPIEVEDGKRIAEILKQYPEQYEKMKAAIELAKTQLGKLMET
jgi:hypothetical protein